KLSLLVADNLAAFYRGAIDWIAPVAGRLSHYSYRLPAECSPLQRYGSPATPMGQLEAILQSTRRSVYYLLIIDLVMLLSHSALGSAHRRRYSRLWQHPNCQIQPRSIV